MTYKYKCHIQSPLATISYDHNMFIVKATGVNFLSSLIYAQSWSLPKWSILRAGSNSILTKWKMHDTYKHSSLLFRLSVRDEENKF
jgi:hypothetical protein